MLENYYANEEKNINRYHKFWKLAKNLLILQQKMNVNTNDMKNIK